MADDGPGDTDELYALDPNDFVAARNELARALRKAGDRRRAAEVATLRRPTPAAWAVNQLVRHHRAEVDDLVRRGEELRAAQYEALAGGAPGDLRQAGRARRDAVAALAERADALLAGRGGAAGAHAAEVTATLEAASLDAGAAAEVLAGQLSSELQPPSGFGVFDLPVAPRQREAKAPEPPSEAEPDDRRRQVAEAEEAVADARRRWEERSEQARVAVERVGASRVAVQDAEAEVARLEGLLGEAQRRLRGAVRNTELAEDAASRAEEGAARAAGVLREAEKARAALDGD
jgi:hypothetical protein